MTERISTGMRNWILAMKRELLNDCVMKIYTGTAPSSADDATTGTPLVSITKSSATVSTNERSTPGRWSVTIPGTHAEGTYAVNITTADSVTATTCTYTTADPEGHADNNAIAKGLARVINETCQQVFAIAEGANSKLYIQGRVGGLDISAVADGGGTITIVTFSEIEVASRSDALCFALPASGAMSKSTDTWSGTIASSGVAGYFRIVRPDDTGVLSTTEKRLQGAVATSGAELNIGNTSLTATETHTVKTYSLTEPAE
jgi:hypothetical protein